MRNIFFQSSSGSPQTVEWHAWRQKGIGGSDSIILAAQEGLVKSPTWVKTTKWLWEVKTGRRSGEIPANAAMRRGTENESAARERFIKETSLMVAPVFGENDNKPFIRASFDGMDFFKTSIVEIKVPSDSIHAAAKKGNIPEYYLIQMAHQGLVAWEHPDNFDGKNFFYVSYHPETDDIAIIDNVMSGGFNVPLVSCLKPYAERMIELEENFWQSVKTDELPCGPEWVAAAHAWISAEQEISEWDEKKDLAKERLIQLLGTKAKEAGGGIILSRLNKNGNIDYQKLLSELLPDLPTSEIEKYRKLASKKDSFMIRKQEIVL